jgi:predicted DNA-binding transcriptional regulator AlpA
MTATSDIFEHRRRANAENGSQPGQVARLHPLDERLIDELAPLLADKLAPLLIERLADGLGLTREQLAERLGGPAREQSEGLVDAHEIARRTGRSRWWVYEHAGELGAVRLGAGSRPRLAFRPSRVDQYLQAATQPRQPIPAPARARPQRRQRGRRTSTGVELLPIGHRDA